MSGNMYLGRKLLTYRKKWLIIQQKEAMELFAIASFCYLNKE